MSSSVTWQKALTHSFFKFCVPLRSQWNTSELPWRELRWFVMTVLCKCEFCIFKFMHIPSYSFHSLFLLSFHVSFSPFLPLLLSLFLLLLFLPFTVFCIETQKLSGTIRAVARDIFHSGKMKIHSSCSVAKTSKQ